MDVRCERCDTEYELEDDAVPPGGCPVQCTSCGYTFMVARPDSASAPNRDPEPAPAPAEWLLETVDGKLHRFRNLTSLQKWIIERKVTREDKISRTGHAWRRLGEIVELGPFFDVVDEADRAKAAEASHADPRPTAHDSRARVMNRPHPPAPTAPGDTLTGRPGPRPILTSDGIDIDPRDRTPRLPNDEPDDRYAGQDARGSYHGRANSKDDDAFDGGVEEDPAAEFEERVITSLVPSHSSPVIRFGVVFLIAAGVAAGAVYFSRTGAELVPDSVPAHPSEPPGRVTATPAEPASAPAQPVAPTPAPTIPEAPPPEVAQPELAPPTSAADQATAPPATPTTTPLAARPVKAGPGLTLPAEEMSYDKLLEQADRVLENGGTERAFKLYERALSLRPDGVDALVGLGYVMMDRGRNALAVSYFQRALGIAPQFGPALFGLGEALRAAGNDAEALRAYQRYVDANPSGRYTMAARRQIQALQESTGKALPNTELP